LAEQDKHVEECVHFWIVDSYEVGVCKYCREKKNFRLLKPMNRTVVSVNNETPHKDIRKSYKG